MSRVTVMANGAVKSAGTPHSLSLSRAHALSLSRDVDVCRSQIYGVVCVCVYMCVCIHVCMHVCVCPGTFQELHARDPSLSSLSRAPKRMSFFQKTLSKEHKTGGTHG